MLDFIYSLEYMSTQHIIVNYCATEVSLAQVRMYVPVALLRTLVSVWSMHSLGAIYSGVICMTILTREREMAIDVFVQLFVES